MSKLYYSATSKGFFSDAVHDVLPNDAVEITQAEHKELLDGQSVGLAIVPDANGKPVLQVIDTAIPFEVLKASLKTSIDTAAETERLKYITAGTGQAMTYQQKVDEARALKAVSNPKSEDYPILASEVGITAPTLAEVADTVLAAYRQWQQIGAAIEAIRLGAKRDIDAAADEATARAVVDATNWPSAQQGGIGNE